MKDSNTSFSRLFYVPIFAFLSLFILPMQVEANNSSPERVMSCNVDVNGDEGTVTIDGLNAPHTIVKLFNPDWSINYECFDNCNTTETVNGLSPGTYHVSIKMYDASWQETCTQIQDVVVTEDTGGGDCDINWYATNTSVVVQDLFATHIIIKLFNPDWSLNYECFDNCPEPTTISGLTPGATYHLSYKIYDASWQVICEDIVDITTDGSSGNLADLTASNFQTDPASAPEYAPVDYTFDLNNIGTTTASGNYEIVTYFSTDMILDNNDEILDVIDTGNTPVGTNNVGGSFEVPFATAGDYYLIIKVDADLNIEESDENNNVTVIPFEVTVGTGGCDINWYTTSTSVVVQDLFATHIILKLFNPDWSLNYECFDNCPEPTTISGLTPGATYHLSYKIYNGSWELVCENLVDVTTDGNGNLPDLSPSNIIAPSSIDEGGVMDFTFDLSNFGTAIAVEEYAVNFLVTSALSQDVVGQINPAGTAPGVITGVVGSADLAGFPAGSYNLVVVVDAEADVVESDESNNVTSVPFVINSVGGGDECGFIKEDFVFTDLQAIGCTAVEVNNNFVLTCPTQFVGNSYTSVEVIINQEGEITEVEEFSYPEPSSDFIDVSFQNGEVYVQYLEAVSFNQRWFTMVDLDLGSNYDLIDLVAKAGRIVYDGTLVIGTAVGENLTTGAFEFFQFTIKFDDDGNVLHENILGQNVFAADFFSLFGNSYTTNNGYLFTIIESNLLSFLKFSENGDFEWITSVASDLPSNDLKSVKVSPNGQYIYAVNVNNQRAFIDKLNTSTGQKIYDLAVDSELGSGGLGQNIEDFVFTNDGGIVTGYSAVNFNTGDRDFTYGKIDANGNKVWEQTFSSSEEFIPLLATNDGGYLFARTEIIDNGLRSTLSYFKTTSTGELTPTCDGSGGGGTTPLACDLSYTYDNGNLSIDGPGLDAPHVIIKIFGPTWNTVLSCIDDCGSSIDIGGLSDGTYHISIKLYDNGWQRTCAEIVDINLNSTSDFRVGEHQNMFVFNALKNGRAVSLNWAVNNSNETDYFIIERSVDGETFERLDELDALSESTQAIQYRLMDEAPNLGINYYRMKQVFADGTVRYSAIKKVAFDIDLAAITLFPNPTSQDLFLTMDAYEGRNGNIQIINQLGQILATKNYDSLPSEPIQFSLKEWKSGIYQVMIKIENQKVITKKLVVTKL